MSAYICDKEVFLFLAFAADCRRFNHGSNFSYYWNHERHYVSGADGLSALANTLLLENIKSVSFRYPGDKSSATLPGPNESEPITAQDFRQVLWLDINPVQVLKTISCLEYQSCEHPEWKTSEALAILKALEGAAISALPGYDDAEWGAPETYAQKQAQRRKSA